MTQTPIQSITTILVIAAVTFLIRSLPFIIFRSNKPIPPYILYLGKVLPYAVIGMLVVYCLKSTNVLAYPYGLPELITVVVIILVHKWKHNMLLSVGGGTALYMFLVQCLFA
ncbi:MAG TPA: branched-chain amino acid transporter AzlD [Clostridiales bacterium]|nr:branched-chain amino acid transporter AzlD [Clostridiales bacterium]